MSSPEAPATTPPPKTIEELITGTHLPREEGGPTDQGPQAPQFQPGQAEGLLAASDGAEENERPES